MNLDFTSIVEYMPEILSGLRLTLLLTVLGFVISVVLGLPLAITRMSRRLWLQLPAASLISFLLAIPTVVQLFLIYYTLPTFTDIRLPDFQILALTLGIAHMAPMAENYRAGLQAVDRGQQDAGKVLGLSRVQTFRFVVLPQAVTMVLPALINTTITIVKGSSLATFIGAPDLLNIGRQVAIRSFRPIEILTFVALIYFALTYPISLGSSRLQRSLRAFRRETSP